MQTVQQAKTLALLIALLTLKSIFHPKNFVKLMTEDQVLKSESETKRILKAFQLTDLDSNVVLASSQVCSQ